MKTTLSLIITCTILCSCSSGSIKENITGTWKITEMTIDIPNVPEVLIANAKAIALATTYEINTDLSYIMTTSATAQDHGCTQEGVATINEGKKLITFSVDKFLVPYNGDWKAVEKNEMNATIFEPLTLKVEKISSSQLVLSGEQNNGYYYYTLAKTEQ